MFMLLQCRGRSSVSEHGPQLGGSWAKVTSLSAPLSSFSSPLSVTEVNPLNNKNGHVAKRLQDHFHEAGAAFTKEHSPALPSFSCSLLPTEPWKPVFHALMTELPGKTRSPAAASVAGRRRRQSLASTL